MRPYAAVAAASLCPRKEPITVFKVPNVLEYSPQLREEIARGKEITVRKQEADRRAHQLTERVRSGPTAEERAADAQRVVRGEALPDFDAELKLVLREMRALEDAEKDQLARIEAARKAAARGICDEMRPHYQRGMKKLVPLLCEAHAVWNDIFAMKRAMLDQGIQLHGIFQVEPDFLGLPDDRTSDFAGFLRECVGAGYLSSLPKEFER